MDRKAIKQRAKDSFRMRYWPVIGIELLAGVLVGSSGFSFRFNGSNSGNSDWKQFFNDVPFAKEITATAVIIGILLALAGMAYMFLFGNVVRVGISGVRLSVYRQQEFRVVDLFKGLKQYGRIVGTMALETLFITLGFFCFIVPGIIVALGLFEVPYLLADDPSLSGMDAIRRSWEDMKGNKGKLFVLGLSFFGWIMLTILTCGVLAVFYTGPYMAVSEAGFYHELQEQKAKEASAVEAAQA